jgi:hypothetical protein
LDVRERYVLDRVLALTVDPRGCTRIRFAAQTRDAFGQTTDVTAEVWLRPAATGRPAALLDLDGEDPRVPERYETVDFVTRSRKLFTDSEDGQDDAVPLIPRLVRAAWLHRLGEDALASQWLATRRPLDRNVFRDLRDWLAWHDYSKGVNAYIARDDAEAALRFDRFARRYADLDADYGTAAHEVAAELRRREGRRGRPAASAPPADFASWPAGRRVAWWIDQLDEVDTRLRGGRREPLPLRLPQRAFASPADIPLTNQKTASARISLLARPGKSANAETSGLTLELPELLAAGCPPAAGKHRRDAP